MKAMVIDDDMLIVGSSNFDFMRYHILEELVVMTRDRDMLDAFVGRAWEPDLTAARRAERCRAGDEARRRAVRLGSCLAWALG
jgi:phosphatidylserine/phosphatidylglycerophosphate/cardiolipin synthase-like enzyme